MLSHMQAKGLSAGYNGEAVFRGLDLKITEGSITTLIGSNGSGKSTILKTLCRIISPDSGAVYLDGEAIHRMPTKRVAQRLALLPQGAQAHFEEDLAQWKLYHLKCELLSSGIHIDAKRSRRKGSGDHPVGSCQYRHEFS